MNTEKALCALGVGDANLTAEQETDLENRGYFIVENYFDAATIEEMRNAYDLCAPTATMVEFTGRSQGGVGAPSTIESQSVFLLDLFNKSPLFDPLLTIKPMLVAAHRLLGEIKVFSLNGRSPAKGKGQQALHSDAPKQHETDWRIVNTLIPLDELTDENGATRLIPGSHKWPALKVPEENIGDDVFPEPMADELAMFPEDPMAEHPDEIRLYLKPGSVAVLNAHLWHGGTTNKSGAPRRLFHMALCRRDTPQEYSQRERLTWSLWERSSPAQRFLLDVEGQFQ
jgi:ectoine hydroxylase-related dioxygenase (phytanoyl-CoA dioxygenase family)